VRLIDIEATPADSADANSAATTARPATKAFAETTGSAIRLHAFAKFLDSSLNVFFAAVAEILCAPLCARDAYGFRWSIEAGSIEWKARKITAVLFAIVCIPGRSSVCISGRSK